MDQDQLSPRRGKAFTFTEISEGVEIFKAHSYGNGNFIPDIPSEGLEVCFELKKYHDTLDIQIHDANLLQWLHAIPSLHNGFVADATPWSINMARLLPYYCELREKFNQDRFQGLTFTALQLFMLHFIRDRSIFAIFGLEDLYQAGTLTEVHFRDLDSWDWDCSMSKDLDCLDEIINELDERGELDDLDELDEPDEQDEEEPCHPVTPTHETPHSQLLAFIRQGDSKTGEEFIPITPINPMTFDAIKSYKRGVGHCWPLLTLVAGNGKSKIIEALIAKEVAKEFPDLEDCPVVAAIRAQERRTILRRLFGKIASSLKRLLHAGASQGASTGLVNFAHKASTETSRTIWKLGKRVIRNICEGHLPSSLPEIVSILQVANAMRSAVPASDLVCSRKEFVNDIPKWAALLNEEDQFLFLEIAEHLWCLPPRVEIDPTPDTFSIWENLKRLVNSLMRASGLFDHDFEHSSNQDRLQPLRQRHLPGMSPSHTHEGGPPLAKGRPLPAPDLQETPHTNIPEPPDPEGGHSSILRDITYLMTGAVFGAILLFLCLHRYGYSTLSLPILASYDREGSDLDRVMNRNCVILALYIEPTFCVGPGSWEMTDHLPVSTSLSIVPRERAEEHLAAFESRSEGAHTTINPPDVLDAAVEDAPQGCSPKLQSQAPTPSSVTLVSPSTSNTATAPDLTRTAVREDGYMRCNVGSCTARIKPGKNQKGNYNRHLRQQHFKEVMYECKWEGCSWKKPVRYNVEVHERTCKKRANGIKAELGQRRRRRKGQPTGLNTRRTP